jgi:preprotein translocase subunit YajC
MLASSVVRTAGINWESVGVIVSLVAIIVTIMMWIMNRREHRADAATREQRAEMTSSLDHMTEVLLAKLETKETVARISERLARVEAMVGTNGGR